MRISPFSTSRRDAVARSEDEGGKLFGVHVEITIDPFHNHMNAALQRISGTGRRRGNRPHSLMCFDPVFVRRHAGILFEHPDEMPV